MSEVALVPKTITRLGVVPTVEESLSTSNEYLVPNTGNTVLRISNGTSAITKLTVITQQETDEEKVTNREVEVAKSTTKYVGPFPPSIYNVKGNFVFKLSAITEVKVEIVQF